MSARNSFNDFVSPVERDLDDVSRHGLTAGNIQPSTKGAEDTDHE